MKRVVVVVNKWWECHPALAAIMNANAQPPPNGLPWPKLFSSPRPRPDPRNLPPENPDPTPRAVFNLTNVSAEIWCVSDLLEHLPDTGKYQSSSQQKAKVLGKIFHQSVDLTIAVGTAALPCDSRTENGNVAIGTKIFMHNGHPGGSNPDSNWTDGPFDRIVDSPLAPDTFARIADADMASIANRFLVPPCSPAPANRLLCKFENVALGTINVTDTAEYASADLQTVSESARAPGTGPLVSLETTHGLIRIQCKTPFLFISGITNRLGHFDEEVKPRSYSQNTVAAHNAGVALAWLLPQIDKVL
jgi:hypothetical protein